MGISIKVKGEAEHKIHTMIRLAEHIKDNTHISSTRESHDKVVLSYYFSSS